MRYGEHQTRSTDALVWLLSHDEPAAPEELPTVLSCRMALLAAHRERCELAVRGADVRRAVFHDRQPGRDFGALARSGTAALAQLLDEYPTFADHADRFTDVLQRDDLTPQGIAWVQAAKHAVLATEVVATHANWRSQPDQAWQVVADIADAAQAMARLDRRLATPADGASIARRPSLATSAAELALAARHVGYVSRCGPLDSDVDAVMRREATHGVVPVRSPNDLPPALAATARLLECNDLSLAGLRRFAIMQAEISWLCSEHSSGPQWATLRSAFDQRDTRLRALAGATARVSSIGPVRDRPVLAQTQEIGRGLLAAKRAGQKFSTGLLLDLDAEQSRVAVALADNVRRALHDGRYLVVDHESVALKWRRVATREQPQILAAAALEGGIEDRSRVSPDLDFAALHLASGDRRTTSPRRLLGASASRGHLSDFLARQPAGRRPLAPNHWPARQL